jgi:hypothetical protein
MIYSLLISLISTISLRMIWHTKNLQKNIVQNSGVNSTKLYSDAITSFRTLYTSEVIPVIKQYNHPINHNHHETNAFRNLKYFIGRKDCYK